MISQTSNEEISETIPDFESRINAIRGDGQHLAESERGFFEPHFGHDFSQVRLHPDTRAAETARAVIVRSWWDGM